MNDLDRRLRLYARPGMLLLIGLVLLFSVDPTAPVANPFEQVLVPVKKMLFFASIGLTAAGLVWGSWRAWLAYRWEAGKLDGGCENCGGPLQHREGRWGDYSKCIMCGSTRKGWH